MRLYFLRVLAQPEKNPSESVEKLQHAEAQSGPGITIRRQRVNVEFLFLLRIQSHQVGIVVHNAGGAFSCMPDSFGWTQLSSIERS